MEITLRKADFSDIEFLFRLRNQPSTYQYAKNNRPVGWQEHINWITPIIEGATNKNLFVIEADEEKVGQVRLDIEEKKATVNVSLLPEFQRKGIAALAIAMAIEKVKAEAPFDIILAEVHQDNIASQKLFEKLSFQPRSQEGVWKKYEKRI